MEHTNEFLPLLIVLALAFFAPLAVSRIKALPVVVGEILAGLIFAQLGFLDAGHTPTLTLFSNIGLAFLMFLAGIEIELPALVGKFELDRQMRRFPVPLLALVAYMITLGFAAGGAYLLEQWQMPGNAVLLALVLGSTSLGVVLPVLKDRNLIRTDGGQAVFLTATIADFFTVILLAIYIMLKEKGLHPEILSFFLIILVFIGAARFGIRFLRLPRAQHLITELSHATVQIKIRGAIVILLVFVVLAESLGIELILGAFLAGMLVGMFKLPQDESLVHRLEAFGFGMFIPIFFIVTGANLNLPALIANPQNLVYLPALLGVSIVVKLVPALALRREMGWRASVGAGFLLNTHLSLEIAIAVIGEKLGLLSSSVSALYIVFAILTVVLMPLAFSLLQPAAAGEHASQRRWIFGWNNPLARSVAQQLRRHGDEVSILIQGAGCDGEDRDPAYATVSADVFGLRPLKVDTVLALATHDRENLEICRAAREANLSHVVALVNEPANIDTFQRLGVQVFSQGLYRAEVITIMARNPTMFELLTSVSDQRNLLELIVVNTSLDGSRIRDLVIPGEYLLLSVLRDGEKIIPHGNTRLKLNDQISVFVEDENAEEVIQYFSS